MIGGFLALALGPEGVGRLTDSNGIFPDHTFELWHAVPGLLINVMSASLLLDERLPAPCKTWAISSSHVVFAGISALSVPLIAALGLPIFTILAVVITVGLTTWGMRRATLEQSALQRAS